MTTEVHTGRPVESEHVLQHHALLYRDEREFLAGALPHLRAGIAAGEATFAVTAGPETGALRDALGAGAALVQFIDPPQICRNPMRAMAAFSALARTLGSRPAWVLLAFDWTEHPDVIEWARYDSIVNQAFAGVEFRGLCCYDTRTLPADVLDLVRRTHPKLQEGGGLRENPAYTDPETFVADVDGRPLAACPQTAASMRVLPADLHAMRTFVAEQAKRCGLAGDALHNLLVAVTEVATNAVRHGSAPVTVRAWPDNGLICEITDSGHWQPEELITWVPPESAVEPGFGLWGVGMLCDTVQVRTGPQGTTVRLRACA
ncbi:sensor histidine kinase [Streptomyces sp. NPDC046831]|uniref:sensor histidine kinase n=1 Tax=Streptomyces sp. NPDC046831 TaxID=3154805 RepID=UPI0033C3334D